VYFAKLFRRINIMTFFLFFIYVWKIRQDDINSCVINIKIINVVFIAVISFRLETLALSIRDGH
jgi:hypothetical protein